MSLSKYAIKRYLHESKLYNKVQTTSYTQPCQQTSKKHLQQFFGQMKPGLTRTTTMWKCTVVAHWGKMRKTVPLSKHLIVHAALFSFLFVWLSSLVCQPALLACVLLSSCLLPLVSVISLSLVEFFLPPWICGFSCQLYAAVFVSKSFFFLYADTPHIVFEQAFHYGAETFYRCLSLWQL